MVDVVTQAQAQETNAAEAQAADSTAAEEMAIAAQEAAVTDTTAEVEEPSSEQQGWDDILDEEGSSDEILEDAIAGTPEEEPAAETPEDLETPATEVADEVQPPAEEAAVEPEVPADEVVVPEAEVPQDTRTPEEVQTEITEARETAKGKLRESFTWTEEQETQFQDDPGAVMSDMAATLFLDLYDSITQGLNSQMPGMVQGIMQRQTAVRQAEQQFYGAWPQLAKAEYRQTVDRIATTYRQQNPTTDNATAITEIGAQAWVALKLPLEDLVTHTQGQPAPASAPVTKPPTHVPASAGNTTQAAHAPAKPAMNDFEQLANELLIEDD